MSDAPRKMTQRSAPLGRGGLVDMRDAGRLDWLELMAHKNRGGLTLHADRHPHCALGLGLIDGRTLRQAIDDAMGNTPGETDARR